MKVNVGILVSYDYELLKNSLPTVYEHADSITLAIDENLSTWKGGKFTIDPALFTWLEAFDTQKKIKIYRDNFYVPELSPAQNDTRERNMLAEQMGDGWIVQLDADEYFIDFKGFTDFLKGLNYKKPTQILGLWITMFKKLDDGILYIKKPSRFYLATNDPQYKKCRNTKQMKIIAPYLVLHQSWARTEEELEQKLQNWGHSKDFDLNAYMDFWRGLSKENYHTAKDFHPLNGKWWDKLDYAEGSTMDEVLANLKKDLPPISKPWVFFKNLGQKIKFGRLFG